MSVRSSEQRWLEEQLPRVMNPLNDPNLDQEARLRIMNNQKIKEDQRKKAALERQRKAQGMSAERNAGEKRDREESESSDGEDDPKPETKKPRVTPSPGSASAAKAGSASAKKSAKTRKPTSSRLVYDKIGDHEYPGWPKYSAITPKQSATTIRALKRSTKEDRQMLGEIGEALLDREQKNMPKGWPKKGTFDDKRPKMGTPKRESNLWFKTIDEGKGLKSTSDLFKWSKEMSPRDWERKSGIPWPLWRHITPLCKLEPGETKDEASQGWIEDDAENNPLSGHEGEKPAFKKTQTPVRKPGKVPSYVEPTEVSDTETPDKRPEYRASVGMTNFGPVHEHRLEEKKTPSELLRTARSDISRAQRMYDELLEEKEERKYSGKMTNLPSLDNVMENLETLEEVIIRELAAGSSVSRSFQTFKLSLGNYQGELGWAIAQAEGSKEGTESPPENTERSSRVEDESMTMGYTFQGVEESGQKTTPPRFSMNDVPTPGKDGRPLTFHESMTKEQEERDKKERLEEMPPPPKPPGFVFDFGTTGGTQSQTPAFSQGVPQFGHAGFIFRKEKEKSPSASLFGDTESGKHAPAPKMTGTQPLKPNTVQPQTKKTDPWVERNKVMQAWPKIRKRVYTMAREAPRMQKHLDLLVGQKGWNWDQRGLREALPAALSGKNWRADKSEAKGDPIPDNGVDQEALEALSSPESLERVILNLLKIDYNNPDELEEGWYEYQAALDHHQQDKAMEEKRWTEVNKLLEKGENPDQKFENVDYDILDTPRYKKGLQRIVAWQAMEPMRLVSEGYPELKDWLDAHVKADKDANIGRIKKAQLKTQFNTRLVKAEKDGNVVASPGNPGAAGVPEVEKTSGEGVDKAKTTEPAVEATKKEPEVSQTAGADAPAVIESVEKVGQKSDIQLESGTTNTTLEVTEDAGGNEEVISLEDPDIEATKQAEQDEAERQEAERILGGLEQGYGDAQTS